MNINQVLITIKYSQIKELQRQYYINSRILDDYFCPAIATPIPDNEFLEVPRLIIKSIHGHSELNVSPLALTFNVFKIDYNWNECIKYITERLDIIKKFLDKLNVDNKIEYIGLIVNLSRECKDDACKVLSSSLLGKSQKNLFDLNIRYTFVENDREYVNIQVQNVRAFKKNIGMDTSSDLLDSYLNQNVIGVTIDINDRYAFNNDKNYKSSISVTNELINKMTIIINNKVDTLIEKGEYIND